MSLNHLSKHCGRFADRLKIDITYWKHEVGSLGFMKEITGANLLGGVAVTGTLREITGSELDEARKNDSSMSK